jgi:ABC-type amino acid transport substrate-binding protein
MWFLVLGSGVWAQSIEVCLVQPSGVLENANSGWVADLNREVLARVAQVSQYAFHVESCPGKRAIDLFRNGQVTLIFPTVAGSLHDPDNISYYYPDSIDSGRLMVSEYVAFTLKGKSAPRQLKDLKGCRVGYMSGANLPIAFTRSGALLEGADIMDQNFSKLAAGRLDCVIALKVVGMASLSATPRSHIVIGPPLMSVYGGYSAQANPVGRDLIRLINSQIEALVKDGTYRRIMESSGSSVY